MFAVHCSDDCQHANGTLIVSLEVCVLVCETFGVGSAGLRAGEGPNLKLTGS